VLARESKREREREREKERKRKETDRERGERKRRETERERERERDGTERKREEREKEVEHTFGLFLTFRGVTVTLLWISFRSGRLSGSTIKGNSPNSRWTSYWYSWNS
jgi:Flp pilus assembly protein TadB